MRCEGSKPKFAHCRGHEFKNDGDIGILTQRFLHALANRQFIALNVNFDKRDISRMAPKKAVDGDHRNADLSGPWMRRAKLFRDDPVIRMVAIVDPQIDGAVLSTDSQLHGNDFATELRLNRGLLQNSEVERLRFEGIDLATGFRGSRQNGGGVADVRAYIEHISTIDDGGIGEDQVPQVVFNLALVEEVGGLK